MVMRSKKGRLVRFTDAYVRAVKPADKRFTVWGADGLGLRVSPEGRRSWVYVYRRAGRLQWFTIGAYPTVNVAEAHAAHAQAMLERDRGTDPVERKKAQKAARDGMLQPPLEGLSFDRLATEYLERHAKVNKRSWKLDQGLLKKHVLPAWGTRRADEIRRKDVLALLDRIVAKGTPIAANRVLSVVRKLFNFAMDRDLVENTPCARVQRPAQEHERERFLSLEEIGKFLRTRDVPEVAMSPTTRLALEFLLATAARPGEAAGARWAEFDLEAESWTIPASRSKNGHAHRVPLSRFALRILDDTRKLELPNLTWVFPSPTGKAAMRPLSMTHALRRSMKALKMEAFTPRDLRRSVATHISAMGHPRLVVARILNHADRTITHVYDRHGYAQQMKLALDDWGSQLERLSVAPAGKKRTRREQA